MILFEIFWVFQSEKKNSGVSTITIDFEKLLQAESVREEEIRSEETRWKFDIQLEKFVLLPI